MNGSRGTAASWGRDAGFARHHTRSRTRSRMMTSTRELSSVTAMSQSHAATPPDAGTDPRYWLKVLAPYREPSHRRSLAELAVSAFPFAGIWVAMWLSIGRGYYWLALLLAVPAAGFLVRLFMIQHDCGHGSWFRS